MAAPKKPAPKVRVTRDGEVLAIDPSKLKAAEAEGFTPISDEKADQIVRMREASTVGGEVLGTLEAAGDEITFGGLSQLETKILGVDPRDLAARMEGKDAARVVGAALPALASGGSSLGATVGVQAGKAVGKAALAKGLASQVGRAGKAALKYSPAGLVSQGGEAIAAGRGLLGAAAGAAVEGAASGIGSTITEEALGGGPITAERLAANAGMGMGLGALLGTGAHAAGGVLAKAGSAARGGLIDAVEKASAGAPTSAAARTSDTWWSKAIRKGESFSGASDADIRVLHDGLPDKELRSLMHAGKDGIAKVHAELGEAIVEPVNQLNSVWANIRRETGGDARIRNFDSLESPTAGALRRSPQQARDFMRTHGELMQKKLDEMFDPDDGQRLVSESEVHDLKEMIRMHKAAEDKLQGNDVTGAQAQRIVDAVRQDVGDLKGKLYKQAQGVAGTHEMLRNASRANDLYKPYREHVVDEGIYGKAGAAHKADLEVWSGAMGAESDLRRSSAALAKLFDPRGSADIKTAMNLANGRAGATKRALFDDVIKKRGAALDVLEKTHDLSPALKKQIAEYRTAEKSMYDGFKAREKKVEFVDTLYRVRNEGESGLSPSNVGASGAAALAGALGFGVGGIPGAMLGAVVGAASKPFTTARWLASAYDMVERFKLREAGIVGGASRMMDGLPPAVSAAKAITATVAEKGAGAVRRGAVAATMADRKRKALEIRDRINTIAMNPETLAEALGNPSAWDAAPGLTKAHSVLSARAVAYLKSVEPHTFRPMYGNTEMVDPVEVARYERCLEGVVDPYAQLEKLWSGRITSDHIEAIQAVYPEMLDSVRNGIMEEMGKRVADGKAIDYRAKSRLGVVLRMPLTDAQLPQNAAAIQAAIQPQPQEQPQAKMGRPPAMIADDLKAENAMTSSERRESGIDRA